MSALRQDYFLIASMSRLPQIQPSQLLITDGGALINMYCFIKNFIG